MLSKKYLAISGLMIALVSVFSLSAFAASEKSGGERDFAKFEGERPELTDEMKADMEEKMAEMKKVHEAVQAALETGDYDEWYQTVSEYHPDAPILDVITADNFDRFLDAHELMEEAHTTMEEARGILEELGVEKEGFGPFGQGPHGPGKFLKKLDN